MNANIKAGMYLIKLILDDGRDKAAYTVSLFVLDPPVSSTASAASKNETFTS
jgi:hypothetical protein